MNKRCLLFAILTFSLFSALFAKDFYGLSVPDSSEIRSQIVEKWFKQDLAHLRVQESEVFENSLGKKFQVRLEELDDELYAVIVAPETKMELELITANGSQKRLVEVYPYDLQGSWILFKSKKTENPLSVRWYFNKDSQIFAEFSCQNQPNINSQMRKTRNDEKVYASFVLYNMFLAKSIPVGLSIEDLFTISFDDLVELSKNAFPWDYAKIETYLYEDNLQMIGVIREKLETIFYEHDACYDGDFRPVRISTGLERAESARIEKAKDKNSKYTISLDEFGFTKWIVDGLVRPISGSLLELAPLKAQTVEFKAGSKADVLMDKSNVYFGLDWVRNLAAAYRSVTSGSIYNAKNSGCEVMIHPFSAQATSQGVKSIPLYLKDNGYSVDCLKALFYVLAIQEPGRFYLGALREIDENTPENPYYVRTLAFFPYFDEKENFGVAVFENGKEYELEDFIKNNSEKFVNLVRLQSSQRFYPQ